MRSFTSLKFCIITRFKSCLSLVFIAKWEYGLAFS